MSTLSSFNFSGKKALIRVDFNVPLNSDLEVTDASRIEAAKPTIIHVLEQGGSAILMSHLGRPGGEAKPELSLKHVNKVPKERRKVQFSDHILKRHASDKILINKQ